MAAAIAVIVAALIAGPLMWRLNRLDKKNSAEHAESMVQLMEIKGIATRTERRMDDHITWHAHSSSPAVVSTVTVHPAPPTEPTPEPAEEVSV